MRVLAFFSLICAAFLYSSYQQRYDNYKSAYYTARNFIASEYPDEFPLDSMECKCCFLKVHAREFANVPENVFETYQKDTNILSLTYAQEPFSDCVKFKHLSERIPSCYYLGARLIIDNVDTIQLIPGKWEVSPSCGFYPNIDHGYYTFTLPQPNRFNKKHYSQFTLSMNSSVIYFCDYLW